MQDGAAITFFDRTYDEAFDLLIEARNYVAGGQPGAAAPVPPEDRLVASCETMRLTSRLVQVMAWLLVQKAVHAGELDPFDADEPLRRLGGHEVCAESGPWDLSGIPRPLRILLDRSQALYNRVARLDEMVHIRASQAREQAAGAGSPSAPALRAPEPGEAGGRPGLRPVPEPTCSTPSSD